MSGFSKENRPPVFTYVVVVLPENILIVYKKKQLYNDGELAVEK